MEIKVKKREPLQEKPDWNEIGFGKYLTDHMFHMDYDEGIGWHDARIEPTGPITLPPHAVVLHYGQETFEGLKAYRRPDGHVQLFRPDMNAKRLIQSNIRMGIPEIPEEMFVEAVTSLVEMESEWVPPFGDESSLYIRPFVYATEGMLGLHRPSQYRFSILMSPCGPYFGTGLQPVKILVEDEYVRAVRGGTGFTKCGGNYAGAILATELAEKKGYSQVLWLDGIFRKYVEEAGGMNFMYLMDGEFWTAPLEGTVLPGVTRDSIIQTLHDWGYTVHEDFVTIDDLMEGVRQGRVTEAFACGTAAVIGPIGSLTFRGEEAVIGNFETGKVTKKLYDYLTGIQWGTVEDPHGWTLFVC